MNRGRSTIGEENAVRTALVSVATSDELSNILANKRNSLAYSVSTTASRICSVQLFRSFDDVRRECSLGDEVNQLRVGDQGKNLANKSDWLLLELLGFKVVA